MKQKISDYSLCCVCPNCEALVLVQGTTIETAVLEKKEDVK